MEILDQISSLMQKGKARDVKKLVQQAIDEGVSAEKILNESLLPGMSIVGEKFKKNELYVPEVMMAARAMKEGTAILKPLLISSHSSSIGRVVIGTVKGDLHDIGKNLVAMMMEGKGFEVIDLGTDVSAERFIQTALDQDVSIICCSALLTTTMVEMKKVIQTAIDAGIRDRVTIMIGGAPVNQKYADSIGADIYTEDAASAADAAVEALKP